jgi:hypothetical protein
MRSGCIVPDLDVVGVDQETPFSELAHHREGLGVSEDADDGLDVFV